MNIKVNLHWHQWRELTNEQAIVVEVSGNTTGEYLKRLVEHFPALDKEIFDMDGKLLGYLAIFVNGEEAFPEELAKPVKDGDEIDIVALIGGG